MPNRGSGRGQSLLPARVPLRREYFTVSRSTSVCPWKGIARYYTLKVDGMVNRNAAWYYPHPTPLARRIKNHVAFWKGVRIQEVSAR